MLSKKYKLKASAIAVLTIFFILSILYVIGFLHQFQQKLSDNLYGEKQASENIVIVAIDDKSIQEIGRWPWPREQFTKFFEKIDNAKTIAVDVAFFEQYDVEKDSQLANIVKIRNNVIMPIEFTKFEKTNRHIFGTEFMKPVYPMNDSVKKLAYINIVTDDDGITRSLLLDLHDTYHSFPYEAYSEFTNMDLNYSKYIDNQKLVINFVGIPGTFRTISFSDVLYDRIDKTILEGKLVLIGSTSPDLHDEYFVPTSDGKAMPGVEIHANAIQTIMNRDFLKHQSTLSILLVILFLSVVVAILLNYVKLWIAAIISLGIVVSYNIFAIFFFSQGIILNLIYPSLTVIFTFISITAIFYLHEEKNKRWITDIFGKYVSKDVVDELIKNPESLKLGGEKKHVTIMFCDIRNFTSISEKLNPKQLVNFLNKYFTEMTQVIIKDKGMVDKYIGDAIMALWGAPLSEKNHSRYACIAAIGMKEKMLYLKEHSKDKNISQLNIGIGIHSGYAVVGNMGSNDRFNYTAMGDSVNLASRLEGLSKEYGVQIIVSQSVYEKNEREFAFRELDEVIVKGRRTPVKIYELIGTKKDLSKPLEEILKTFKEGLLLYRKREFEKAIELFTKSAKLGDKPSEKFIDRCKYYIENDPGNTWDKIWVMKTK